MFLHRSLKGLLGHAGILLGGVLIFVGTAAADPVVLRVGVGNAAEEQLWLMQAKPEVAPNQGKVYTLDVSRFGGTDQRFQAFEAGALDFATASANAATLAASEGSKFKIVASLSRESERGFVTKYLVRADSPIKTVKDLKGKTFALNGLNSSAHLWAKLVLEKNGLDLDRDITFIPVRFPAHGEALRSGKVDIATFPQPFAQAEEMKGGVRTLFVSKDAMPFEEELMLVIASPQALQEKEAAARAFLQDLVAATKYYIEHPREARKALIDAKQVRIAPDVYLPMSDYYREPSGRVDVQALEKMQEVMIANGFQRRRADLNEVVDLSYLPKD